MTHTLKISLFFKENKRERKQERKRVKNCERSINLSIKKDEEYE